MLQIFLKSGKYFESGNKTKVFKSGKMVSLSKSTAGVVFAFYPQLRKLSNVRRKKVSLLELRLKVELSFLSKNKKRSQL